MRRRAIWIAWGLSVLALGLPGPGAAQEGAVSPPDEAFVDDVLLLYQQGRLPRQVEEQVDSLLVAKLAWEREKIATAREVVARTNRTARLGTIIVHAAVVVGFLVAILEFVHSWRLRREGPSAEHEVRIGLEGVAVRTSLYGLLILLVASGFYLMYLKFVYPIQVIAP